MISIEKGKVIIRVNIPEGYGHAFIYGLQKELVQLMHAVATAKYGFKEPFNTTFPNLRMLQEALVPSIAELRQMYPIETVEEEENEDEQRSLTTQ